MGKLYLVATHAMTVENPNLLVLFAGHIVQTLVGLHISDLSGEKNPPNINTGGFVMVCVCVCVYVKHYINKDLSAYLSEGVIVAGNLGVGIDVFQVPTERFTLELLSENRARRDVTVVHFSHT